MHTTIWTLLCVLIGLIALTVPTQSKVPPCKDTYQGCGYWKDEGHCHPSSKYYSNMKAFCKATCNLCGSQPRPQPTSSGRRRTPLPVQPRTRAPTHAPTKCEDAYPQECVKYKQRGYCNRDSRYYSYSTRVCKKTCGHCRGGPQPTPLPVQPTNSGGSSCVRSSPVGLGSGAIPDNAFTASSYRRQGSWAATAFMARLNAKDKAVLGGTNYIGGWCAARQSKNEYLQIDLGKIATVTRISTQGRYRSREVVKAYSLSYSVDGRQFNKYQENGNVVVFRGNSYQDRVHTNSLRSPFQARFVRIHPVRWYLICLRVELYTCDQQGSRPVTSYPVTQAPTTEGPCADKDSRCVKWAGEWQCLKNKDWMAEACPKSCRTCGPQPSVQPPQPRRTFDCGIKYTGSIIGGTDAKQGDWPWQAALYLKGSGPVCGGTLLTSQWILTAAHCFRSRSQTQDWKIILGETDFYRKEGSEQEIDIAPGGILLHPRYRGRYDYDIALVKLAKPAKPTTRVNTVCPHDGEPVFKPGTTCFVTGWGNVRSDGQASSTLQQAVMPLVDDRSCEKDRNLRGCFKKDHMLCAGPDRPGRETCERDSGGPLVCRDPGQGRWIQVGVVSWGHGCTSRGIYGAYQKVKSFEPWIKSNIGIDKNLEP